MKCPKHPYYTGAIRRPTGTCAQCWAMYRLHTQTQEQLRRMGRPDIGGMLGLLFEALDAEKRGTNA